MGRSSDQEHDQKRHAQIRTWFQNVCDKQTYDPEWDFEDHVFWVKWQAPLLLIMKPSRYQPYDRAQEWTRKEPKRSSRLLDSFAEHYVLHVERLLKDVAGELPLKLVNKQYSTAQPKQ